MARWKIVNSLTAKDLGIEEASEDNEGYIVVDLAKLPQGLTAKDAIRFAEKTGVIMKYDPKPKEG
jgi:hypothetical protein